MVRMVFMHLIETLDQLTIRSCETKVFSTIQKVPPTGQPAGRAGQGADAARNRQLPPSQAERRRPPPPPSSRQAPPGQQLGPRTARRRPPRAASTNPSFPPQGTERAPLVRPWEQDQELAATSTSTVPTVQLHSIPEHPTATHQPHEHLDSHINHHSKNSN